MKAVVSYRTFSAWFLAFVYLLRDMARYKRKHEMEIGEREDIRNETKMGVLYT